MKKIIAITAAVLIAVSMSACAQRNIQVQAGFPEKCYELGGALLDNGVELICQFKSLAGLELVGPNAK